MFIKKARVCLMVSSIDSHLIPKEVFGIPEMTRKGRRHGADVLEKARIGIAVSLDNGVAGVADVIVDAPIKGIHDDLHRVSDVIEGLLLSVPIESGR